MTEINLGELIQQGEKLQEEGKFDEAIQRFQQVVEAKEDYVLGHLTLAVLHGKVGQHEDAVKHGEKACKLEPNEPFNFTAMSVTYQRAFAGTQNQQYIPLAEEAMAHAHRLQGR
ncbi:MAG: scaffolding protein [Pirellulaceae bacterium]|nr:scaffolding protein [Pirellulaceae bacterium]